MTVEPKPLERFAEETETLVREYSPLFYHPNKMLAYSLACPPGSTHSGKVSYSRWPWLKLPGKFSVSPTDERVLIKQTIYDYQPIPGYEPGLEWHVNFADPNLFVAYGSGLFARDEIQVLEHPALGSLKEALIDNSLSPLTVENGMATPVLIAGANRNWVSSKQWKPKIVNQMQNAAKLSHPRGV